MRLTRRNCFGLVVSTVLLIGFSPLSACNSHHIDATIENRTGGTITLLEVDYPSASFGSDTLESGGNYHYRFQTRGSGPISVQYTSRDGHPMQDTGPTLYEKQQGSIEIVLLPGGKAEFHPFLQR
jgi:hypothetical protein